MIHYSLVGYMIGAAIVMIVSIIAYRILLENQVRPSANRMILLSIYAISFLIPLLAALIPESGNIPGIEFGTPEFAGVVGNISSNQSEDAINLSKIFQWVESLYLLGFLLTFLFSILTISYLIFLSRGCKKTYIIGIEIYVHGNKKLSSFSWGNKIFLYEKSLTSEFKDLQMLIAHEKAHLDRSHWIDLAVAQIIIIFQWFNPAAWYMRRELQRIHEYEADGAVLKSGIDERDYQMLLIQNISGSRYSNLTDGLNNCSLKKRIIMMKKTKFKKDWMTRGIAVFGFAVLGGLIINIPVVAEVLRETPNAEDKFEKVIVIKGESKEVNTNVTPEYLIDGEKIEKEKLALVDPSNIREMTIDKSSENPKVEITTKKAPDLDETDKMNLREDKKKGDLENYPDAYISVDKVAEYEGGQSQLLKDLTETTVYPEEALQQKIQGRVVVRFQINTNGTLSNCEIAYSQYPSLDEAALKAVENLPGKWQPAEVDGKPVASIFNIPVTFKLR